MKEQIIKKPTINDYPSTDSRTYIELDGKVNWEKYAKALDEFIIILAEYKCDHSEDELNNETWGEEPQTCLNCKNAGICDDDFVCKREPIKTE